MNEKLKVSKVSKMSAGVVEVCWLRIEGIKEFEGIRELCDRLEVATSACP